MSAGVHSGTFGCFLVGGSHRELILAGPDVSTVVAMEGTADAGEVVVSPATAAAIDPRLVGPTKGDGHRLRRVQVRVPDDPAPRGVATDLDLRGYLPAPIVAHVEAGGGQPAHRTVGIAFCHFDGTDGLMRDAGPAAVATALDGLVRVVQEEADRSGVLFLATDVDEDGGKVILASGIPTATEADADALLATVRRIADHDLPLPLRIGVHRGAVFAGEVGPPYRRTYTVMGDAVNLAARPDGPGRARPHHRQPGDPRPVAYVVRDHAARTVHGEGQAPAGGGVRARRRRDASPRAPPSRSPSSVARTCARDSPRRSPPFGTVTDSRSRSSARRASGSRGSPTSCGRSRPTCPCSRWRCNPYEASTPYARLLVAAPRRARPRPRGAA